MFLEESQSLTGERRSRSVSHYRVALKDSVLRRTWGVYPMFTSQREGTYLHASFAISPRSTDFTCRLTNFSRFIISYFIFEIPELHKHTLSEPLNCICDGLLWAPVIYSHRANLNSCVKQSTIFRKKKKKRERLRSKLLHFHQEKTPFNDIYGNTVALQNTSL